MHLNAQTMLAEPKMQGSVEQLDKLWSKLQTVKPLPPYSLNGSESVDVRAVIRGIPVYLVKG